MASREYSTWKSLPSGEKVLTPRSYSLRVRNIIKNYATIFANVKCKKNEVVMVGK